uniref:GDYXXLXY domain-containing protein n=1 Tax=Flavobacterium sp. TaxID=239 RepID=UPI004049ECE3
MKKNKWYFILINLILLLFFFNKSIVEKEKILAEGTLVLLKLAPFDPRSLMQGDYMRLNYEISNNLNRNERHKRGFCIIELDENGVGSNIRCQKDNSPIEEGEYAIPYTTDDWSINIGAESYFFEEGQADKYEKAEYGGLKIDLSGNVILVGLYDENFIKIE